ncbi:MAG: DUF4956 domain-containing protein [Anaerolineales bacterium]|nr:DUF4956 domain-containing protein [Anaerolineales bacterium]
MKPKIKSIIALSAAVLLAAGQGARPAAAQNPGFQESFDDPKLPGWEHSPEAIVADGFLRIGPGNFASRAGAWQDFDLGFKLRFSGSGETHANYRASDAGGYLLAILEGNMVLFKNQPSDQSTELAKSSGWQPAENTWMEFTITLKGGEHTVSVDGSRVLTATDPEPLGAGTVVFASHGERTSEVDDVSLQGIAPDAGAEGAAEPAAQPSGLATPAPGPTAAPDGFQALWQELAAAQGTTLDLGAFAVNLLLAVASSFILSRVYIHWGSSLSNRRKFAANFMLVTATTTFIILVVRSSVALSLGLVGALSIIRFRTAVKEPEELAYLFFAISLGIGLGDNQRLVTLLSLVVVILLIGLARLLRQTQADINLHLTVTSRAPGKAGMQQVQEVIGKHCEKLRLIRYDENADRMELSYVVEFRHLADLEKARAALQAISPAMEISFLDNKGIW